MKAKEIIKIVKQSNLWASLGEKEKQEAIKHALKSSQQPATEEDIRTTVGEVYLDLK
jgi:hypothetical protein